MSKSFNRPRNRDRYIGDHSEEHQSAELASVVQRTEGLQPWRRVFHVASVVAIGVFVCLAGAESPLARTMVAGVLTAALVVDWIRLRFVVANITFFRVFSDLASPREATKLASSTWFLIGALAVLVIAPPRLFFPTMLAFAFADPAASLVGRFRGRRRLGKGTWEGTGVFFLVAATILTPLVGIGVALITAVAAAAVEVLSVGLDDNLTVPPVIAIVLWLAGV